MEFSEGGAPKVLIQHFHIRTAWAPGFEKITCLCECHVVICMQVGNSECRSAIAAGIAMQECRMCILRQCM